MTHKNHIYYFNIFILTITIVFSNIFNINAFAETESSTEATTEAPSIINNYCEPSKTVDVSARAAIIADADTGIVLYEKNADEVLYPASITKIMTALLGCEYGKFDETITHSENAINGIGYGSSTMGMEIGEQISLEDCLYGIMMCSANEACMALAEHISGTVDAFVAQMNSRAEALGCTNTHFANPHGFHDENHYTTARDMSLITLEAIKNEKFCEIWGTMLRTLPPTNIVNEPRGLVNRAKILDDESQYYYPGILGAKTGFHDEAKNTLVAYAEKDNKKLITVVMKCDGAANAYGDTKILMDYGFTQYENKLVYDGSDFSQSVNAIQTYNNIAYPMGNVDALVTDKLEMLLPKSADMTKITTEAVLEDRVEVPVAAGDVIGTMKVFYDGNEFGQLDIVSNTDIARLDDREMAKRELWNEVKYWGKIALIYGGIALVVIIIFILIVRSIIKSRRKKRMLKRRRAAQHRKHKRRPPEAQGNIPRRRKRPEEARATKRPEGQRRPGKK